MSWRRFLHRKRSDAELQDEIEAFLAKRQLTTRRAECRSTRPGVRRT